MGWSAPPADVGDEITQMLGRVTRGMHRLHGDGADAKVVAVVEKHHVFPLPRPLIPPVRSAFRGQIEGDPGIRRKLARPADKIRVNVGFRHGGDPQPVRCGNLTITGYVPLGINHQGLTTALAADQVGILRERGVFNLTKKHDSRRSGRRGGGCSRAFSPAKDPCRTSR